MSMLLMLPEEAGFTPKRLFAPSTIGDFWGLDNFAYLSQKADGSLPLTALEQPVGLMRGQRNGGAVGAELYANQQSVISNPGDGATVTHTAATRTANVTVVGTYNSYPRMQIPIGMSAGKRYVVTGRIDGVRTNINGVRLAISGITSGLAYNSTTGVFHGIQMADGPILEVMIDGTKTGSVTVAEFSVRELPGIHWYQPTDAARPVISARYNLLLATEDFSNAAWVKGTGATITTKAGVAPDGMMTADKWETDGSTAYVRQSFSGSVYQLPYTGTIYAKYLSGSPWVRLMWFDGSGTNQNRMWVNVQAGALATHGAGGTATQTAATVETAGNGWYKITLAGTQPSTTGYWQITCQSADGSTSDAVGEFLLWHPDLRLTADANGRLPAYQRVTTSTDYDSVGFPRFLRIDATDDSMQTAVVTPGTDKVFFCGGVTKMSDAATAILIEMSANAASSNGAFFIAAPGGAGATQYGFLSRGTSSGAATKSGAVAPNTSVISSIGDISADTANIRANGALATGSGDQGTGDYLAYNLYLAARAGVSIRLNNGRIYPFMLGFMPVTAGEIAAAEAYYNNLCKAF